MNILLLEPYYTGSHAAWAEGYARHSRHRVRIFSLTGYFWKWRMHGGAVTLAREFLQADFSPDLILATDMLDLTTFLALTRGKTASIPTALYFHENQLCYPWSATDRDVIQKRDKHYGFINYVSALAADAVFFNSQYHQDCFLHELPRLLKHFPDHRELSGVKRIAEKSAVLPLGLDLRRLDQSRPEQKTDQPNRKPLILWNHRWEHDKNPGEFFRALYELADRGLEFKVAILGENFSKNPVEFEIARKRLGPRIVHYGFEPDFALYAQWLRRADILPVTSNQDFFGASVVQAVYCRTYPLLPHRLAYPEILPIERFPQLFYRTFEELANKLASAILKCRHLQTDELHRQVAQYDWQHMAPIYDAALSELAKN